WGCSSTREQQAAAQAADAARAHEVAAQSASELSRVTVAGRHAMMIAPPPAPPPPGYWQPANTEQYAEIDDNPVHRASEQPVSTFSIDVDTGSYANVRRMLREGTRP